MGVTGWIHAWNIIFLEMSLKFHVLEMKDSGRWLSCWPCVNKPAARNENQGKWGPPWPLLPEMCQEAKGWWLWVWTLSSVLTLLLSKDVVFLNHVVPQFPQMQGEDNYSIYGMGLLWESNRGMHQNCELPAWDTGSTQQGQQLLLWARGHPVKVGDPQRLGGRRRRETCRSLRTLCAFVLSIFCTVCIHYLDLFFKSNRVPC